MATKSSFHHENKLVPPSPRIPIPGQSIRVPPLSLVQLINESRLALLWQSPERILPRCRRKSSVSGPGNWSQDHLHHGASDQSEASIDKHWPIGSGYIALRISRRGQSRNCPLPSHCPGRWHRGHYMMSGGDQSEAGISGDKSDAEKVWHVTRDTAIRYAYQELSSSIQTMALIFYKGHISHLLRLNQEKWKLFWSTSQKIEHKRWPCPYIRPF